MSETPGERLVRTVDDAEDDESSLCSALCGGLKINRMSARQFICVDKWARAFLASYGVEVPE